MSGIAIYMEGGGEGNATKAALRQGMDTFLQPIKEAARDKALPWKLVCCGPRNEAFQRFQNAVNSSADAVSVLLVDSEGPVKHQSVRRHLQARDKWNLSFTPEETVHLMVQTMETWIVADLAALSKATTGKASGRINSRKRQTLRLYPSLTLNAPCARRRRTRRRGVITRSDMRVTC